MLQAARSTHRESLPESWAWLFPATYLVHIMEEYWCGEGFYRWVARVAGWELAPAQFLVMNGVAWLLMVAGIVLLRKTASVGWLLVSFATVVLINGLLHFAGSLVTGSYSPGLVSGLLLWLPLGTVTLFRSWRSLSRRAFRAGVLVGVVMHAAVFLLLLSVRAFSGA